MKSYLKTVIEFLVTACLQLWQLLKTNFILLLKNKEACKRIILVELFILTWIVGANFGAHRVKVEPEIVYVYQEPVLEEFDSRAIAQTEQDQDIKAIAKVLYGYRYNSERDLEGIVWVILNRVDDQTEFKNFSSIEAVVGQPSQWMGYSDSNPVVEDLYSIAERVVSEYNSDGKRPFGKDFLFFTWSQDYIVFRTEFKESPTCKHWRSY